MHIGIWDILVRSLYEINVADPICYVIRASECDDNLIINFVIGYISEYTTVVIGDSSHLSDAGDRVAGLSAFPVFQIVFLTESSQRVINSFLT